MRVTRALLAREYGLSQKDPQGLDPPLREIYFSGSTRKRRHKLDAQNFV